MISKIIGTISKQNIRTKASWFKLCVALILSNVFFYILFSPSEKEMTLSPSHPGSVQVLLKAELQTPFQKGKKISIVNRQRRLQLEGVLEEAMNEEGKLVIWVAEEQASLLFQFENWEIIPFLKNYKLPGVVRGESHEIRY